MNQNYLSRENTDCLKGICAIMVVICHVCSRTNIGASIGLGPIYTAFGYWAVSGFMFMSGYGLTRSILNKYNGGGYLQIFLSKRVLPIYMLMALLSVVYYGMGHLLALEPPSLSCFIQSFFFGNTVIKLVSTGNCSYLFAVLYFCKDFNEGRTYQSRSSVMYSYDFCIKPVYGRMLDNESI